MVLLLHGARKGLLGSSCCLDFKPTFYFQTSPFPWTRRFITPPVSSLGSPKGQVDSFLPLRIASLYSCVRGLRCSPSLLPLLYTFRMFDALSCFLFTSFPFPVFPSSCGCCCFFSFSFSFFSSSF